MLDGVRASRQPSSLLDAGSTYVLLALRKTRSCFLEHLQVLQNRENVNTKPKLRGQIGHRRS